MGAKVIKKECCFRFGTFRFEIYIIDRFISLSPAQVFETCEVEGCSFVYSWLPFFNTQNTKNPQTVSCLPLLPHKMKKNHKYRKKIPVFVVIKT